MKLFSKEWIRQFIKFCLIGGSNLVVSYIAYLAVLKVIDNLFLANLAAFFAGIINSFIWNNIWVFRRKADETRNPWAVLGKMFVMYAATGIVLNYFLLLLWVEVCGISKGVAPIINSILGIPINFVVSKFWCFKVKKKETTEE